MSLSLTKKTIVPNKSEKNDVDVHINHDHVYAVMYDRNSERIVWKKKWDIDLDDLFKKTTDFNDNEFIKIVHELNHLIGAMAPSIYLILPDPLFKHVTLDIAEIPKKSSELQQILRWRISEEFYLDTENMAIDYAFLPGSKNRLSIFCLDKKYINELINIFSHQNLLVSGYSPFSLASNISYESKANEQAFLTANKYYMSFGIYSGNNVFSLFDSTYIGTNNFTDRLNYIKRARREIVSAIISNDDVLTAKIIVSSPEQIQELGDVFPDFVIEYCQDIKLSSMAMVI